MNGIDQLNLFFSLISNSVGLGNVWRFPYLVANNGGGTLFTRFPHVISIL